MNYNQSDVTSLAVSSLMQKHAAEDEEIAHPYSPSQQSTRVTSTPLTNLKWAKVFIRNLVYEPKLLCLLRVGLLTP